MDSHLFLYEYVVSICNDPNTLLGILVIERNSLPSGGPVVIMCHFQYWFAQLLCVNLDKFFKVSISLSTGDDIHLLCVSDIAIMRVKC